MSHTSDSQPDDQAFSLEDISTVVRSAIKDELSRINDRLNKIDERLDSVDRKFQERIDDLVDITTRLETDLEHREAPMRNRPMLTFAPKGTSFHEPPRRWKRDHPYRR